VTDFAELILADRKGREIATLWVTADGKTGLILDQRDHAEAEMTEITPGALRVGAVGRHYVAIQTRPGDPYIKVVGERSQAVLGRAELTAVRTGATETRPAASLMFFDKDGKITWSAP
jgi:hypothetical protein